MNLDLSDFETGPDRPVRDTKERLQKVKKRNWKGGEIMGGIQDAIREALNKKGKENGDQ